MAQFGTHQVDVKLVMMNQNELLHWREEWVDYIFLQVWKWWKYVELLQKAVMEDTPHLFIRNGHSLGNWSPFDSSQEEQKAASWIITSQQS